MNIENPVGISCQELWYFSFQAQMEREINVMILLPTWSKWGSGVLYGWTSLLRILKSYSGRMREGLCHKESYSPGWTLLHPQKINRESSWWWANYNKLKLGTHSREWGPHSSMSSLMFGLHWDAVGTLKRSPQ